MAARTAFRVLSAPVIYDANTRTFVYLNTGVQVAPDEDQLSNIADGFTSDDHHKWYIFEYKWGTRTLTGILPCVAIWEQPSSLAGLIIRAVGIVPRYAWPVDIATRGLSWQSPLSFTVSLWAKTYKARERLRRTMPITRPIPP